MKSWYGWTDEIKSKTKPEDLDEVKEALRKIYSNIKYLAMMSSIKTHQINKKKILKNVKLKKKKLISL